MCADICVETCVYRHVHTDMCADMRMDTFLHGRERNAPARARASVRPCIRACVRTVGVPLEQLLEEAGCDELDGSHRHEHCNRQPTIHHSWAEWQRQALLRGILPCQKRVVDELASRARGHTEHAVLAAAQSMQFRSRIQLPSVLHPGLQGPCCVHRGGGGSVGPVGGKCQQRLTGAPPEISPTADEESHW